MENDLLPRRGKETIPEEKRKILTLLTGGMLRRFFSLCFLLCLLPCTTAFSKEYKETQYTALVEDLFKAINLVNYKAIDTFIDSECPITSLGAYPCLKNTVAIPQHSSFSQHIHYLASAFPDFVFSIQEIASSANKVLVHATLCGIQKGPFYGFSSSHVIRLHFFFVFSIEKGKIKHIQELWNESLLAKDHSSVLQENK